MSPRYTEFLANLLPMKWELKILFIGSFFLDGINYLPAFSYQADVDQKKVNICSCTFNVLQFVIS